MEKKKHGLVENKFYTPFEVRSTAKGIAKEKGLPLSQLYQIWTEQGILNSKIEKRMKKGRR